MQFDGCLLFAYIQTPYDVDQIDFEYCQVESFQVGNNPFTPVSEMDFFLSMLQTEVKTEIVNRLANNVDPYEMACLEKSHLDLHCLHRYLFWSTKLKGIILFVFIPSHTIVAGYYGFMLDVSVSVHQSYVHPYFTSG